MHNGKRITNGSILLIQKIGENDMMALICQTSKVNCCYKRGHRFGNWYYPGGTKQVPASHKNEKFYRNRSDDGEVFLCKCANNMTAETGIYCCVVPDRNKNCGINQMLCVNLGKNINSISANFKFNRLIL